MLKEMSKIYFKNHVLNKGGGSMFQTNQTNQTKVARKGKRLKLEKWEYKKAQSGCKSKAKYKGGRSKRG